MDLFRRLASIETDDRKKKLLLSSMQDLDSKSVVLRQAAQGDVFLDSALSIDSKAPHNIAEIIPYYISAGERI